MVPPAILVKRERPLRAATIAAALVTVAVLLAPAENIAGLSSVLILYATLLPVGLTRRLISADRHPARWIVLFQNPVSPIIHYGLYTLFTAGVIFALYLTPVLALALRGAATAGPLAIGSLWLFLMTMVGAAFSSWLRAFDSEAVLFWLALTILEKVWVPSVGLEGPPATFLGLILVPLDEAVLSWQALQAGTAPDLNALLTLAAYSLACLLAAAAGIFMASRKDLTRATV